MMNKDEFINAFGSLVDTMYALEQWRKGKWSYDLNTLTYIVNKRDRNIGILRNEGYAVNKYMSFKDVQVICRQNLTIYA